MNRYQFKESHPVNLPKPWNHGYCLTCRHVRIEPEMAFANLEDDMDCAEAYIRPAANSQKKGYVALRGDGW